MSIFLLFNNPDNNNTNNINNVNNVNNVYDELQYLYILITKVKAILRDDFSAITVDTKMSTRPNRKTDLRNSFTGALDQTIAKVGSERGYATRRSL